MADDVVIGADQFFASEAGNLLKRIVDVGDCALEVGFGNEIAPCRKRLFSLGDGLIDFHDCSGEGRWAEAVMA